MPRSNRPRRGGAARPGGTTPELDLGRALGGTPRRESHRDGDWFVRPVSPTAAAKTYRCPGCQQEVPAGVPHVVAWPADGLGDVTDRRHWHTPCWSARGRRTPRGSSR